MKVACLRNAVFKTCSFSKLKLNTLPQPKADPSEGYDVKPTQVRFPRVIEDPDNIYNNIVVGYSRPLTMNYAEYDRNLHRQHTQDFVLENFDEANVYEWGIDGRFIWMVDLHHSTVESSQIHHLSIYETNTYSTVFKNVNFVGVKFKDMVLYKSIFFDCTFSKCEFEKVVFNDSKMIQCQVGDSLFNECVLDLQATNNQFRDVKFQWTTIPSGTYRGCLFSQCDFHSVNFVRPIDIVETFEDDGQREFMMDMAERERTCSYVRMPLQTVSNDVVQCQWNNIKLVE